jgi:Fe-S-cluster containining protein
MGSMTDTEQKAAGPVKLSEAQRIVRLQEIERGLQFANVMASVNQDQANEAVAIVQALVDVLASKGLIDPQDLEGPLERARKELEEILMPRVRLGSLGDKYAEGQTVDIPCLELLPLCLGRCCTLKFFLTKQDLDEGVARWDYGNPYWIKQAADGYCIHSDAQTRACTIHARRPHICRGFDCRNNKRIWIDFEKRIPAPFEQAPGDAAVSMAEVAMQRTKDAERKQKQESGPRQGASRQGT